MQQRGGLQLACGSAGHCRRIGKTPVGPLLDDGVAAQLRMAQDQRIDARDPAGLQDLKALLAKWMERMGDSRPSQRGIGLLCS